MKTIEEIKAAVAEWLRGSADSARLEIVANASPCGQHSLRFAPSHALPIAGFLRDRLSFDYLSNVTGVDWPDSLEAVYHLYSIKEKAGPLVIRMRTVNRIDQVDLPSLTPIWRSAEFQEREVFDLYGIVFTGHPDLRRILMWDGFKDHPMRRDYREPDDFEWEPTAHDAVLTRAQEHRNAAAPMAAGKEIGGGQWK